MGIAWSTTRGCLPMLIHSLNMEPRQEIKWAENGHRSNVRLEVEMIWSSLEYN